METAALEFKIAVMDLTMILLMGIALGAALATTIVAIMVSKASRRR